jgi:hypothetical protein
MDKRHLSDVMDEAEISYCFHPYRSEHKIEQRLWEPLRLRMQAIYRRSTGEQDAVLVITTGETGQK